MAIAHDLEGQMTTAESEAPSPGLSVGPTSEFSLFFHVQGSLGYGNNAVEVPFVDAR
jgi:hypothetical protein